MHRSGDAVVGGVLLPGDRDSAPGAAQAVAAPVGCMERGGARGV